MKIAIATVQVPFITGGAEILCNMLKDELIKRGHKAEIVTIPFKWYPTKQLVNSMMMGRLMDLSEVNGEKIDKVIVMKFPAYYVKHDNKVMWLMHQHRQAYDLWGTEYSDLTDLPDGEEIRDMIKSCDEKYIPECKKIFTIAATTSKRLKEFNHIDSTPLYHPPLNYEALHCESYGDYIFYASRIDSIKRQRLLVEAAKYIKSDAKIVIAGSGAQKELDYIDKIIKDNKLEDRVKMAGFISEEEKINYYANCLAVYFGAYNEDYGYITLESFFAEKTVIVHKDAGGPLEFVEDGKNGYVIDDNAKAIAKKIDFLYENREKAKELGQNGKKSLLEKNMNWDYVIEQLLSE